MQPKDAVIVILKQAKALLRQTSVLKYQCSIKEVRQGLSRRLSIDPSSFGEFVLDLKDYPNISYCNMPLWME